MSHDEGVDFCGAFVCVGNSGVGSPILIGDQVVLVLCVSGPTARILDRLDEMAVATRDADRTRQLSALLLLQCSGYAQMFSWYPSDTYG